MFSFIAKNKKLDLILNHFEKKHSLLLKKPTQKNKPFNQKAEKNKLFFAVYLYFTITDTYFFHCLSEFYSFKELTSRNFQEFRINFKHRKLEDFKVSSFSPFHQEERIKTFINLLHENYSFQTRLEKHQNRKKNDKSSSFYLLDWFSIKLATSDFHFHPIVNRLQTCDGSEDAIFDKKKFPLLLFNQNLQILAQLIFFRANFIESFRLSSYLLNFDSYLETLFFLDFLIFENIRQLYRYNFIITTLPYIK